MKAKFAGIVCLLILAGAWFYIHAQASAGPTLPTGPNGRYQIMAVDFDPENLAGNLKHKTAIRIDTQTGHTWELLELPVTGGGSRLYWLSMYEGDPVPATH